MSEEITKRLHDINTFMSTEDNETYLIGKSRVKSILIIFK